MNINDLKDYKKKLDTVSSSFCLAKWLQVTVHLQNGQTHSCHHPRTHKIPLNELESDPSALHNTSLKKQKRKEMLEGHKPEECNYCWKIEDASPDNMSDRIMKSNEMEALGNFETNEVEKISTLPWDSSLNPSYLEVSFGNECNLRCAYCAPHISSAIATEYKKFGPYSPLPYFDLNVLKKDGFIAYDKDEFNPYVEAFWKWWPSLIKDLKVFRITGGEPLLNPNTFQILDSIIADPLPELEIAINSNLSVPDVTFEKFLSKVEHIMEKRLVKKLTLFTSVDTFGKNGEFIRFGMSYEKVMKNVRIFLKRVPSAQLSFMSTYNVFSVVHFDKFLEEVAELKNKYRNEAGYNRVHLDIPYLRDPQFLSCFILSKDYYQYLERDIAFLKLHSQRDDKGYSIFEIFEVSKLERILRWMQANEEETETKFYSRADFYRFITEYQNRKEINLKDYCPEYFDFYMSCRVDYIKLYLLTK